MAERTVSVTLRANVAGFTSQVGAAKQSVSGLSREMKQAARSNRAEMQTVGTALVGIGIATVAAMGASAKAAIDFESSFTGVRKTVDATEPEFEALAGQFRNLATEIPASINEINGVGEAAGQLGIEKENILGFTETMVDLGNTTNLTADEAATSMARIANVTGMPQDEFDRLGSTLVDLGNNFATTESEILDMSTRLSGAGSVVGLSEDQILGLGTALSSVGINAEAGGTAFSRVMVDIEASVQTGGEKLDKFAEVAGVSTEQFAAAWEQDAAGALVSFVEGLGKIDAAGGNTFGVLEELELGEVRVRDALLKTSGASGVLTDALDVGAQAWADNTALTEEAETRYATAASQIEVAKNKIYDVGITIGQTLAPAIGEGAEYIGNLADSFSELPAEAQAGVGILGTIGGLATTAAGGFLLLAPRIVETKDALSALSTSMPRTTGALSAMRGVLLGPWGAALAVGAASLAVWANQQAEARKRVDEHKAALDQQTGAITGNNRELAGSQLVASGAIDAAERLGIALPLVTDAALGNADAQATLKAKLDEVQSGLLLVGEDGIQRYRVGANQANVDINTLGTVTGRLSGELQSAQEQTRLMNEATAVSASVYGGTEESQSAYTGRLAGVAAAEGRVKTATDKTKTAILLATAANRGNIEGLEELIEIKDRVAGRDGNARAAIRAYQSATDAATAAVKENGRSLSANTEKGRANEEALDTMISTANEQANAQLAAGKSIDTVNGSLRKQRQDVYDTAIEMGATAEQARRYADDIESIPDTAKTQALVDDAQARDRLNGLMSRLRDVPSTITTTHRTILVTERRDVGRVAHVTGGPGGITERAGGGPVGPRYTGGFTLVGEAGPEIVKFDQPGKVFSAGETRRMAPVVAAPDAAVVRGGDGASAPVDYGRLSDAMVDAMVRRDVSGVALARRVAEGDRDLARRGAR